MLKFMDASFNALFLFLQHTRAGGGGGGNNGSLKSQKVNHFIIMLKFIDASFNALFFFFSTHKKSGWVEGFCVCVVGGGGVVN